MALALNRFSWGSHFLGTVLLSCLAGLGLAAEAENVEARVSITPRAPASAKSTARDASPIRLDVKVVQIPVTVTEASNRSPALTGLLK